MQNRPSISDSSRPPGSGTPGDDSLGRFANLAAHTSSYRVYLRSRLHYLEYLSPGALANVFQQTCQIPAESSTREGQMQSIRSYANQEHLKVIDEDWARRLAAATSEEKKKIEKEDTDAPPFLLNAQPKRKTGIRWADCEEDCPTSAPRPAPRPTTPQTVDASDLPCTGLTKILQDLSTELGRVNTVKTQMLGMLQNLLTGLNPTKPQLEEMISTLKLSKGNLSGLKIGLDLSVETMKSCDLRTFPILDRPPIARRSQVPSTRPSYATVARSRPSLSQRPSRNKATRQAIAYARQTIRDDDRSMKLRSIKPDGARAAGAIASAIAKILDQTAPTKSIIEDIRTDSRGTIYVQLFQQQFAERCQKLLDSSDADQILNLGDELGKFILSSPTKCAVSGMCPVVMSGVKATHSPAQFVSEIWEGNSVRWGLSQEDSATHIAGVTRMNKKTRQLPPHNSEHSSTPSNWVPSNCMKFFVSRKLLDAMKIKGSSNVDDTRMLARYDYEFLEVRHFNQQKKRCTNCGRYATHDARACRRPAKCVTCGGDHRTSECSTYAPTPLSVHPEVITQHVTSREERERDFYQRDYYAPALSEEEMIIDDINYQYE